MRFWYYRVWYYNVDGAVKKGTIGSINYTVSDAVGDLPAAAPGSNPKVVLPPSIFNITLQNLQDRTIGPKQQHEYTTHSRACWSEDS